MILARFRPCVWCQAPWGRRSAFIHPACWDQITAHMERERIAIDRLQTETHAMRLALTEIRTRPMLKAKGGVPDTAGYMERVRERADIGMGRYPA